MNGKTLTCPDICPSAGASTEKKVYAEAGHTRGEINPNNMPYIPGVIKPYEKKTYPPDAPPRYLPQPTDSTSGDTLGMGPIGPWAPGHMDWTPQAGMTGVRPVVDKYSITHYSTGQWRSNNLETLTPRITTKAQELDVTLRKELKEAADKLQNRLDQSDGKLSEKIKDLTFWEKKVRKTVEAITKEIETLDEDRAKLKGACAILMMPEAIAKECIELRTHRYEPDLVRDDAEQELIKEVAIVGEIRKIFQDTLTRVEIQLANNRAAKAAIEQDWSDKMVTLKLDRNNLATGNDSTKILYHPGIARWPENATTLEYWKHFCQESVRNCEEVREASYNLRQNLHTAIRNGSQDLKTQGERTNMALAESIEATRGMVEALEQKLRENLQTTADMENLMDHLNESIRNLNSKNKLVMSRLHTRNFERPNVENCRDEAQYELMAEAKFIKETVESFANKMRECQAIRADLMKYRGALEKDIAGKRKCLNLDEDRLARVRAHMPTPEEFANA